MLASAQTTHVPEGWQLESGPGPAALLARHGVVLARDGQARTCVLAPRGADEYLLQALERRLGVPLQWQHLTAPEFEPWSLLAQRSARALDGMDEWPEAAGAGLTSPAASPMHELSLAGLGQAGSPAVQMLDALLLDALHDGASDLHLERRAGGASVRMRLDGVMQTLRELEDAALVDAMVSRLKVLAELDIGERRVPQDGRFRLRIRARQVTAAAGAAEVDFRLSVLPTVHGESAVVRVLDRSALQPAQALQQVTLQSLGYPQALAEQVHLQARAPHGLLLVTGPTGSGKTTTLYAVLAALDRAREKLVTIEDPVEYALPGAVQVQVNDRQGLSFARGLRSILRHDPDRVMVGEIRDAETAQIAVQAALTGHLVFSTVHANHALDVLGRFSHMGIQPYDLASALNAVVSQRLLRRLCTACATQRPAAGAGEQARWSGAAMLPQARGCPACRGTGYRGRLAVAELLPLDDTLRALLLARASAARLREAAAAMGAQGLRAVAAAAVQAGQTSPEEVDRVIGIA
jgi:general secretion pathway protein E